MCRVRKVESRTNTKGCRDTLFLIYKPMKGNFFTRGAPHAQFIWNLVMNQIIFEFSCWWKSQYWVKLVGCLRSQSSFLFITFQFSSVFKILKICNTFVNFTEKSSWGYCYYLLNFSLFLQTVP